MYLLAIFFRIFSPIHIWQAPSWNVSGPTPSQIFSELVFTRPSGKIVISWRCFSTVKRIFTNWCQISSLIHTFELQFKKMCFQYNRFYMSPQNWCLSLTELFRQNISICPSLKKNGEVNFIYWMGKHTTCISSWNDVETTVSTSFQREIHVACLY